MHWVMHLRAKFSELKREVCDKGCSSGYSLWRKSHCCLTSQSFREKTSKTGKQGFLFSEKMYVSPHVDPYPSSLKVYSHWANGTEG